jgi:hypothetical protein
MRHKINFLVPRPEGVLADCRDNSPDVLVRAGGDLERLISGTGLCWLIVTHARLRERGETNIALTNTVDPHAINVAHADTIVPGHSPFPDIGSAFVVSVRGEFGQRFFAQYEIVQNCRQEGRRAAYLTHWPQPGLIGRRGPPTAVRRVAFVGQVRPNLVADPAKWARALAARGYEFVAPDRDWHDLSSYDVIVGLRSFDRGGHDRKPPSKLINAWHAGIPFIGGHDSAFSQVGIPEEDYLLAASFEEVLSQLDRLATDSQLRERIVSNGRHKSLQYGNEAIAGQWRDLLDGPIAERFEAWRRRPAVERARSALLYRLDDAHMRLRRNVKALLGAGKAPR